MNTTNILLLIIAIFLGSSVILGVFNSIKNRFVNRWIQLGGAKAIRVVIELAEKGKKFNLKDDQGEVNLIITKKNGKHSKKKQSRTIHQRK